MDKQLLDIYSDYLICSFGMTTATGLSALLNGVISHDKITRFLSGSDFTSADLWHLVKPLVRQVQNKDAVLVIDDSIEEKLYTDESELICWHWDHCFNRNVKGVNFLTCLYRTEEAAFPVAFQLLKKSLWELNKKTGKPKRVCPKTKNDYFREMVAQCRKNKLLFGREYDLSQKGTSYRLYLSAQGEPQGRAVAARQVGGTLCVRCFGFTGSECHAGNLAGGGGFPPCALQAGLYKQGHQSGRSLSGDQ